MKHCQQEMTVIQNAWPVVCNFGWLIEADRNARKGKRYRAEVLNFTARLEDNLVHHTARYDERAAMCWGHTASCGCMCPRSGW